MGDNKEAIRRKKMLIEKKKRRRRRRRLLMLRKLGLICVAMFLVITVIHKWTNQLEAHETQDNSNVQPEVFEPVAAVQTNSGNVTRSNVKVDPELVGQLEDMLDEEPKIKEILEDPGLYPQEMLEFVLKYPETIQFVLDYPEKKDRLTDSSRIDISKDYEKGEIPLFLQWDERWGYHSYGDDGMIGMDGCGPTCLSMVIVGLTGQTDMNPQKVAEFSQAQGYIDPQYGTTWELMTTGAQKLGLRAREIPLDEDVLYNVFAKGQVVICSMRPGDFTTSGHFIVLTGFKNGEITVNDPNSPSRSQKTWKYADIKPQIKNLWAYSY